MRLIDGDALIEELNNNHFPGAPYVDAGISIAIGKVCDAPTIEPERKSGKWNHGLCSVCGYDWGKDALIANVPSFCPNCGSDNRGEQDE